jgi:hypothetical protein
MKDYSDNLVHTLYQHKAQFLDDLREHIISLVLRFDSIKVLRQLP